MIGKVFDQLNIDPKQCSGGEEKMSAANEPVGMRLTWTDLAHELLASVMSIPKGTQSSLEALET
jgi:hypothetical protein